MGYRLGHTVGNGVEKGQQQKSEPRCQKRDELVRPFKKVHQRADFPLISFGQRPVKGEADSGADPKLGQGQHGQDAGKQPVEP